jgi:acyl-coenzyme A thioesterase PaaI-like protein
MEVRAPAEASVTDAGQGEATTAPEAKSNHALRQGNSKLQAWAIRHPRAFRHFLNFYPAFRGTGGWVTSIAPDWSEIRVRLPLSWRTRNYVGTIFGGSLYAALDPHFMFMLMHRLGPEYLVWDKGASIRFRKPGRTQLYAVCKMPDEEIAAVKAALEREAKVDRTYTVDFVSKDGAVCASVEKVVNVRKRAVQSNDR